MSWTVRILIVFWLCFISVSEADLGASCNVNDTSSCTETIESCIGDSCECSSGHFNLSNVCKSSSITVTLATQSDSVVYGSDVILTATITSEVPLNPIKWLKGSTELVISSPKYTQNGVGPGTVKLTINNVDFTDSGNYQVEVSNIAGRTSTSNQVSLNVTGEKPTVIVPMTISETGTTVTIHCTVSVSQNSPALTAVYWLFNGKNLDISNSNKYSGGIVNNASLSIKNLASTDAGEYHCGATNLLGSTNSSRSVTLSPPSSVSISQQPANPVYNGTRITFNGSYNSTLLDVKSIKWQKMNGNAFSDINIMEDKYNESTNTGSNPKLVITKVDFIDKASFRLTVSNAVGNTPSEAVYLNVRDGSISVTLATTSNSARYGSELILVATITSTASVNPIKWQKVSSDGNLENLDITLSKYIQNGVGPGTVTLTIKNVTLTDGGSYQMEVSNAAGNTGKSEKVSFSVKVGQFDESCTDQQICDTSKNLKCTTLNSCRCTSAFYHNNQLCYQKSRLAPIIIHLNSTTAKLSVFWSPPTIDSELVSTYEVTWKVKGASSGSSAHLDNSKSRYTVPSGLMSGQIYIVNVISHVNLTNPEQTIVVTSADFKERLTPLAPGPIIMEQSNFAYDNLQIRWTKPSNTFVTGYEVIIDDIKYTTSSSELMQFNGKNFTPGKYYNVTIVTVSGITDVKKSVKYTKQIRITPTKPEPPRDVRCPEVPLDVSLQISWKAPNNSNGVILQYQITIHLNNPRVINVSSTDLSKNIEGLSPEQSYKFSVRTINDAEESISVSEPSTISCTTKVGVSSPPTSLVLEDVKSREFRITFGVPTTVNGILAGYKIVVQFESKCKQQILVFESQCNQCVNTTSGCPDPLNFDVDNISMPVSYPARGLNPYTTYFVKVTAINGVGEGYSVNATASTDEEVPKTPEQITASNILSRSLTLSWNLSAPSPGNTIYTIFVYEANDEGTGYKLKENLTVYGFSTQSTSVTGLEEYWQYKFKVNAATGKGNTLSEFSNNFRTLQAAPGQVEDLTVGKIKDDYRTAYVSWSLPAMRKHNGVLVEYLFSISNDEVTKLEEIPVSLLNTKVERNISVMPETTYVVTVILQNNETMNSSTSSQEYFASAGLSSAPTNLTVDGIKSRGFRIQFNRPDDVKGILAAYKIVISEGGNCVQQILIHGICSICKSSVGCQSPINHTVSDITNNDVSYTATGLDPYTHYVVKVVAINGKGEGHPVNKTVWTDEEVPLQPGQITASNVQSSSLTLAWTLPDPSPGNTTYTIYIYEGIDDNGTSFLMKESIKVYGFETKMLSVTGLEEYWPYKFQVNAATVKGNRTSDFSSVFKTKGAVVKDDETTSTSSIIGSVVAVILVVTVVVIGIFIWKRNQRHKEYKEQAITYADLNLDDLTKVDQPYSLLEHGNRTVNSKSVPLNSFYDYVMDLLNNNRRKLTKEYHDLLQDTERSASTVASSKDNVSKNRGNIIPYDFNRVRLSSPGASDYIDASVLLDRCYILTSYPIAKTFGNFWQMVWEQNVSTILVMTGHSDDRESWYFLDNEGTVRTMERIDVELLAKFKSSESVTMRKIKLSRGRHSKVVNHFHVISLEMTELPDQILALINTITQNNVKNTGPQVVHGGCTGVDNSGVYIAVDHAVNSVVSGGNEIDVYGTARTVMKERMFSISSLEQYSAIYTCLQKYVQNSPACKNDATGAYEYLP